jgi:putative hemolysin
MARASGVRQLSELYVNIDKGGDVREFIARVLRLLDIEYRLEPGSVDSLPPHGPAIVVANHPFGALDGLIAAHILCGLRRDVKIIANQHLARVPELGDLLLPVDPFGGRGARPSNLRSLRQAACWVRGGGLLLVFPAGEVAHLTLRRWRIEEPAWNHHVASLARITRAPVVPMFFYGRNSLLFQWLGMLHPRLRTLLLPRELLNKRRNIVQVRVGRAIACSRLQRLGDDEAINRYLRLQVMLLGRRYPGARGRRSRGARRRNPAAAAAVARRRGRSSARIAIAGVGRGIARVHCRSGADTVAVTGDRPVARDHVSRSRRRHRPPGRSGPVRYVLFAPVFMGRGAPAGGRRLSTGACRCNSRPLWLAGVV